MKYYFSGHELAPILEKCVENLKSSKGNKVETKKAIERYIDEASKFGVGPMELGDYFTMSDPTLPELAGYSIEELDAIFEVFDLTIEEQIEE